MAVVWLMEYVLAIPEGALRLIVEMDEDDSERPEPAAAAPEPCRDCGGARWNVVCPHCRATDGYEPARTTPDEPGPDRTVAEEAYDALSIAELRGQLHIAETMNAILRQELRRALQEQR